MSEGSGGPWTSPGAQISAQPSDRRHAESADPGQDARRFPMFPAERAERGVELVSRLAGPAVFFLALGGIVWLLVK
ncbi:hypothetical protein Q9Q95_16800 [Sphingomonas sp. DG1-23]|uniref:hypothetical protein n=1 Tax=Sphingomonas sp. DG1-23 TaxID=3068316 RepID=UPI00273E3E2C|nr:hypothetical protein [Sphingomonas sp. DG1-23]MDP5280591.1 hypothetical protein [Sphingomonas sp. DG1-23]